MKPTVSICCTTFNHENYIAKCIEGFLMQQTDFLIEILIFEDASNDGTAEIVKNYAAQDDRIITFIQSENQWSQQKYGMIDWLFPAAKGKYIALCEGDDYWTDPLKLQKQVDILEADPSIAMVYSDAATITDSTLGEFYKGAKRPQGTFNFNQFQNLGFPTATSIVRSEPIMQAQQFLKKMENSIIQGDYVIWAIAGKFGNYHFLEEKTAVYRKHSTGIMGTLGGTRAWFEAGIHLNHALAKELGASTHASFYDGDWWYYMELSFWDLKEKKWGHSVRHLAKSLLAAGRSGKNNRIQILRDYFYWLRQGFSGKN